MKEVTVRPWESADSLDELTDLLHRAYAPLGAMGLNFTAVDQTPEETGERINYGQCFVGIMGGRIVGTVTVEPPYVESTFAYYRLPQVAAARQFAVDPELQRTGIGILLLKRAEAWAAEQGYRELGIDTAAPAVHLLEYYQKLGFEPVGRVQWKGKTYVSVVLGKLVNAVSNGVEQELPS